MCLIHIVTVNVMEIIQNLAICNVVLVMIIQIMINNVMVIAKKHVHVLLIGLMNHALSNAINHVIVKDGYKMAIHINNAIQSVLVIVLYLHLKFKMNVGSHVHQ